MNEDVEQAARARMCTLLHSNLGFANPRQWVDYGLRHSFEAVKAEELTRCPDCLSPARRAIGQYVYYSTLITLQLCDGCDLIYADKRMDPAVVKRHFESSYKQEDYFRSKRSGIFQRIATMIEQCAPPGGRILDVGSAKGHLMGIAMQRRPDLRVTVQDLSEEACSWAASNYGVSTICGSVVDLETHGGEYDVVVFSDVVYYEPEIRRFWRLLPNLVAPAGSIILRVPNRFWLIRCAQAVRSRLSRRRARQMQDRVWFFNPEHLYVFSRTYLEARLSLLGFGDIMVHASPLLASPRDRFLRAGYYQLAKIFSKASVGRLVVTPSILITARNLRELDARVV